MLVWYGPSGVSVKIALLTDEGVCEYVICSREGRRKCPSASLPLVLEQAASRWSRREVWSLGGEQESKAAHQGMPRSISRPGGMECAEQSLQ